MDTLSHFRTIEELVKMLDREKTLFRDMFERRKSLAYLKEFALEVVDYKRDRIQYLIDQGVIHENGDFLEMEDVYVQFFEDVLDVMTRKVISNKIRTLRYQYLPPCSAWRNEYL